MLLGITTTYAADEITVMLNGSQLHFDVEPQIINNRTMVPMRTIFESLGSTVTWNAENQIIIAGYQKSMILLKIDSTVLFIKNLSTNEEKIITLDVPPQIVNGRTLVPIRAISESLGAKVEWDGETKTINIIK
jgi:hypothetical protein